MELPHFGFLKTAWTSHPAQVVAPHVDMTLAELQEMAARQQQQIEAQQQLLASKVGMGSGGGCRGKPFRGGLLHRAGRDAGCPD